MKFALLGADADALSLATAAAAAGHHVAWVADAAGDTSFGEPHPLGQWEDLLDGELVDAVIVGRGAADSQVRCRQLQELVKQGRPVLTSFPLFDSVLSFFEVDMARGESRSLLRHYNPVLSSAPLDALRAALAEHDAASVDALGPIEQVLCERPLEDRSQGSVQWHFARDAELLDVVVGGLDRVGAHGAQAPAGAPDGATQAYAGLSVQLSGRRNLPVRWSVLPPHADAGMRLTLVGARGRMTVVFDEAGVAQRMIRQTTAGQSESPIATQAPAATAIAALVDAVAAGRDDSTWASALHVMELTDSIEISLRRGRMIDVHGQQLTEQLAFRGTMAAVGCALLAVLPPLLLLIGWAAGLLGIELADYWPHALLGLLAAFLGLQVLPKLIYPAGRDDGGASSEK